MYSHVVVKYAPVVLKLIDTRPDPGEAGSSGLIYGRQRAAALLYNFVGTGRIEVWPRWPGQATANGVQPCYRTLTWSFIFSDSRPR